MHEISDLLKRSKFNNVLSYLTYTTKENEAMVENYDSAIDESYETFFADIEKLYTDANREDNKLFDRKITINKFATLSGITQSTVENLMKGKTKNPKLKTLHKLAIGLELP